MNAQPSHTPGLADRQDQERDLSAILEGCRREDRVCQEKLYLLFFDRMLGMIRRYTNDRDTATNILNNGFLRAFQKIEQYQFTGSFEGWLRRIMVHAISDHFRSSKGTDKAYATRELHENAAISTTHDRLEYKELLQALEQLPPATRVVVNLFIIEGYSHKEIAKLLGMSTGTSKWHVATGKKLLQQIIAAQSSHLNKGR